MTATFLSLKGSKQEDYTFPDLTVYAAETVTTTPIAKWNLCFLLTPHHRLEGYSLTFQGNHFIVMSKHKSCHHVINHKTSILLLVLFLNFRGASAEQSKISCILKSQEMLLHYSVTHGGQEIPPTGLKIVLSLQTCFICSALLGYCFLLLLPFTLS